MTAKNNASDKMNEMQLIRIVLGQGKRHYLVTLRLRLSATSGGKESSTTGGGEKGGEVNAIPTAPSDKINPL